MDHAMKVWYDCEFLEDGVTIDMISIGLVRGDNNSYYAVNADAPWERVAAHPWLMKNVVKHLPIITTSSGWAPQFDHPDVKPKEMIADEVYRFLVGSDHSIPALELNAYYSAYDHVCLMQLWGAMVDAPEGVPWYTRDLKVEADRLGVSTKDAAWPQQNPDLEHHALHDAWHDAVIDSYLKQRAVDR